MLDKARRFHIIAMIKNELFILRRVIDRLTKFITDHEGCHIYYESEVTKMNLEGERMASVETKDGKKFTAQKFICNMDPQTAAKIIGLEKFPPEFRSQYSINA